MKPDGRELTHRLRRDFPSSTHLVTSSAKPRVFLKGSDGKIVLEKFAEVVPREVQDKILSLWDQMVAHGVVLGASETERNRASKPSLHLGIWEKLSSTPFVTSETWKKQNPRVRELIAELLSMISKEVAPRMVSLLKVYHPDVWARQENRILARVHRKLAQELKEKPWLDFQGAFFALSIREGCSDRNHIDWSDDKEGRSWVTGVGSWKGASLRTPELGMETPVAPGEVILCNMRKVVHSASPITEGRRLTLTGFTCGLLAKHGLNP
ncbi:hypothetical protein BDP27DRAFT_1234659 [Rhodocollybia butyracea]|uniref:Uncharacterized protein n=1 Tax=Rhodocollybia butyracea TaxID=206335 RepID=A0A9P5PGM5_9AGAR|nr:hypothetical protein BDP27DRAFT_1237445 [Rhodocollybia butyracea]KAF9061745.1 hypothetical protein BDP27DRAFT_1234659 [Rhodocollybia butyracea]